MLWISSSHFYLRNYVTKTASNNQTVFIIRKKKTSSKHHCRTSTREKMQLAKLSIQYCGFFISDLSVNVQGRQSTLGNVLRSIYIYMKVIKRHLIPLDSIFISKLTKGNCWHVMLCTFLVSRCPGARNIFSYFLFWSCQSLLKVITHPKSQLRPLMSHQNTLFVWNKVG